MVNEHPLLDAQEKRFTKILKSLLAFVIILFFLVCWMSVKQGEDRRLRNENTAVAKKQRDLELRKLDSIWVITRHSDTVVTKLDSFFISHKPIKQ